MKAFTFTYPFLFFVKSQKQFTLIVLILVICINIFAFEPNLHISQMTSLASKLLDNVINMHNLQRYYANL